MTVTDDGLGFERSEGGTGMGLHLMHYRARVIGAELDVSKPAEGGCRVTCQMTAGVARSPASGFSPSSADT